MKPEYRPYDPQHVPATWPRTRLHSHTVSNPASAPNGKYLGTLRRTGFSPVLKEERVRPSRLPHWLTSLPDISGDINFSAPRKRERSTVMLNFFPLTTVRTHNPSSYTKMTNLSHFILNYGYCGKDTGFSPHW